MIDSFLTLSRLHRRQSTPHLLDSRAVAEGVIESLKGSIEAKRAKVRIVTTLPPVLADETSFQMALGNLVSNAVKFGDKRRPIVEIGATADLSAGVATFFVRDNGIGIAPEYHDRIFQLFQRLNPPEEYEGTGAGLAICQAAVRSMGGDICLDSQVGKGSAFYFTVPMRAAPRAEEVTAPQRAAPAALPQPVPEP